MNRIMIIANSQGSAIDTDGLPYTEILCENNDLLFSIPKPSIMIDEVYRFSDHLVKTNRPKLLILNLGIVEISNRILSNKAKLVLYTIPILGKKITKKIWEKKVDWLKAKEKINLKQYQKMSIDDFMRYLEMLIEKFQNYEFLENVIVMNVPQLPHSYISNINPFINDFIKTFNRRLGSVGSKDFTVMDIDKILKRNEDNFIKNTVHFTFSGHKLIAAEIQKIINSNNYI